MDDRIFKRIISEEVDKAVNCVHLVGPFENMREVHTIHGHYLPRQVKIFVSYSYTSQEREKLSEDQLREGIRMFIRGLEFAARDSAKKEYDGISGFEQTGLRNIYKPSF